MLYIAASWDAAERHPGGYKEAPTRSQEVCGAVMWNTIKCRIDIKPFVDIKIITAMALVNGERELILMSDSRLSFYVPQLQA